MIHDSDRRIVRFHDPNRDFNNIGRDTWCSEDVRKTSTQKDLMDSQFAQKLSIESNDALVVKEPSRNKRGITCNYCRKKGHLKRDF